MKRLDGSRGALTEAPTPRILHLTLHRKWFDAIATGVKLEEYREPSLYWKKRLVKEFPGGRKVPIRFDEIHFRNGYNPSAPWMRVKWMGMGPGTFEGRGVYAIKLGTILEIKNWSGPAAKPAEVPEAEQSPSIVVGEG